MGLKSQAFMRSIDFHLLSMTTIAVVRVQSQKNKHHLTESTQGGLIMEKSKQKYFAMIKGSPTKAGNLFTGRGRIRICHRV